VIPKMPAATEALLTYIAEFLLSLKALLLATLLSTILLATALLFLRNALNSA